MNSRENSRRFGRRVKFVQAPQADPQPSLGLAERATEDEPHRWGDGSDSNDDRLTQDKPPHYA